MEWLGRLNKIADAIKKSNPNTEQICVNDTKGCLPFLKGALFTLYHFTTGTAIGLALINAYYKLIK